MSPSKMSPSKMSPSKMTKSKASKKSASAPGRRSQQVARNTINEADDMKDKEVNKAVHEVVDGIVDAIARPEEVITHGFGPVKSSSNPQPATQVSSFGKLDIFGESEYDPLLDHLVEEVATLQTPWPPAGYPAHFFESNVQFTSEPTKSAKSTKNRSLPKVAEQTLERAKTLGVNNNNNHKDLNIDFTSTSHQNILPQKLSAKGKKMENTKLTPREGLAKIATENGAAADKLQRILNSQAQVKMVNLEDEIRENTAASSGSSGERGVAEATANTTKFSNVHVPVTLSAVHFGKAHDFINEMHPGKTLGAVTNMVSGLELQFQSESEKGHNKNGGGSRAGAASGAASGGLQRERRGDGNGGTDPSIAAASFGLEEFVDDNDGAAESEAAASLVSDEDLDDMATTIHGNIHLAPLSVGASNSYEGSLSLSNSTLADMSTTFHTGNASHHSDSSNQSGTASASSNDTADPDVMMAGMGVNDRSGDGNEGEGVKDDLDGVVTFNQAEIEKTEFEVSDDDEEIKAADRKKRFNSGDRGKAAIWWWKALRDARADTEVYAARKGDYKDALITQCEYAERLEEENDKLGKLQKANAARIAELEKELNKAHRGRK